jgi:hypothetical protein
MRHLWLLILLAVSAGCMSPVQTMISCQPYGYAPVPVSFSFTLGPVSSMAAEQTALALFRACSAPAASGEPTAAITDIRASSQAAVGEPSGPNAGQRVWLVQIDVTLRDNPAQVHSWTEVNQASGVPTIVALG